MPESKKLLFFSLFPPHRNNDFKPRLAMAIITSHVWMMFLECFMSEFIIYTKPTKQSVTTISIQVQNKQKVVLDKWITVLWNSLLKDVINAQSYEVSETIRVLGKDCQWGFLNQNTQYSEKKWAGNCWKHFLAGIGRKWMWGCLPNSFSS